MRNWHVISVLGLLGPLCILATHCGGAPSESPATSDPQALSSCALSVTDNTYDGPAYWGTVSIKNGESTGVTGFKVSFEVPSGAECTSDAVPSGATLATSSNHCTFAWKSAKIAAGATFTFNYSTDSTSFSAATDVEATASGCSAGANDAGAGGKSDAGSGSKSDAGTGTSDAGAPPSSAIDYAPYFPTWVWGGSGYAISGLADLEKKSGLKEVTIAFVLSNGGCNTTQDIEQNMSDVKAFIAAGGHVKASFGGADGDYVESKCSSASALASAIESFVSATGITDLDFDIEQDAALTDTVNAMRGQALKTVQDAKGIHVAFTLAANPSPNGGLTSQGLSVVSHALSAGVKVSHVNLMTMDFGDQFGGQALAPVVTGALNDGNAQIMSLAGVTKAEAWRMIGVIPMIGKNDDSEVFSLSDAKSLATFAKDNDLGLVSFWSIDRDQVCQSGDDYNSCSTVDTSNFAFDDILQTVTQ